ncbi:MAG: hypothetical protein DMG07_18970 [Acidobacteria bacterium]|nr:MAG: hypothetical protein DMG07_18970 [Acidobacteriota bacterium]
MANTSALARTTPTRSAGLVSLDGRTYPLKGARIEARAEGGVALTTLVQTYANPYTEPLEVLYTLPLPANGAVVGYTIQMGEKIIRGEVRRRAEAREEYRKALLEGRTAAILEQDRADTFTQQLGSLPAGETARIEIEVLQSLEFLPADGDQTPQWEYRFPTVVGIRYEGEPGRVPDAERLDVDRAGGDGTPVRLEGSLLVAGDSASMVRPSSPGREVDLQDTKDGVRVTLRNGFRLDRDLVIRWIAARQEVGVRCVEGAGLSGDDGRYCLITITPPATVSEGFARDLTILIDASGSMSGEPMELLRSLEKVDRFELLAFSNRVRKLIEGPIEATRENIDRALAAVSALEAGGGTEMTRAIMEALQPLRPDSQRQVVLITDGYIGFEGEVIGQVLQRLKSGARLHAVGIGSAPNRTLTRGVARAGRGIEILVGDDDDARVAARRLLRATVRPVLTDIEVRGAALVAVAPQRPRDVLEGQPVVLLAEITSNGGELEIRGRQAGTPAPWVHRLEFPAAKASFPVSRIPLGALLGWEAVEDQELRLASGAANERAAIENEIERLALRHRIASSRTSLIAISESPAVDPKAPRRRERLPVEIPAEVSAESVGLVASAMPALALASLHVVSESSEYLGDNVFFRLSAKRLRRRSAKVEGARLLHVEGQILIFEFEVPVDGCVLPGPGDKVAVEFPDSPSCRARVLGAGSSHAGPHVAGVTVRLQLRLEDNFGWHHRAAHLRWRGLVVLPGSEPATTEVDVELHLEIGAGH